MTALGEPAFRFDRADPVVEHIQAVGIALADDHAHRLTVKGVRGGLVKLCCCKNAPAEFKKL